MDNNPYQTPKSQLDPGKGTPKNSMWWKIYFYISALFLILAIGVIPFIETHWMDYVDLIVSTIGTIGLWGFAFYKPIVNVVFWRYFFYVALVETIIYSVIMVFMGIQRFGEPASFDGVYVFEIVYVSLYMTALYLYAYRRNYIWKRSA